MSVAIHPDLPLIAAGINSQKQQIEKGMNKSCWLFSVDDIKKTIVPITAVSASTCRNVEEYQKVTRFSPSGELLVSGFTDGHVTVHKIPDMQLVFPPLRFNGIQDCDVDPNETHIAVATSKALIIISAEDGSIIQVIDSPRLNGRMECEFRACRYVTTRSSQSITKTQLFAVVNPISRGRGFLCVWNLPPNRPYPITGKAKTASVCRKSIITSFCASPIGNLLAYATTDLTIGIVDPKTLRPIYQIKDAHGFAITSLAFSHDGNTLASAGADTKCRIIKWPGLMRKKEHHLFSEMIYAFLSIILLYLAVYNTNYIILHRT
ncbi:WD40-repeat-containing domain protein [Dichotomocladium elegans]|nr:WD40-repeat-containing domain protein [Dichotomocladium elegans]